MDKATFRKRVIDRIDEGLVDLDEEGLFSEFWIEVQNYIDDYAEYEDANDENADADEDDEGSPDFGED